MNGPPCINGLFVPQYYHVTLKDTDFNICAAPRSGSTSLYYFAQMAGEYATNLREAPETAVCIIRDPIARVGSAYMLLPDGVTRDENNFKTIGRPPIEETIDAILDDDGGRFFTEKIGDSKHAFAWMRHTELYRECKNPIWLRLEGHESFYGHKLPHDNKTEEPKPEVTYRLAELNEYYAEDIELWKKAATKID
jgi:hypothetical protein